MNKAVQWFQDDPDSGSDTSVSAVKPDKRLSLLALPKKNKKKTGGSDEKKKKGGTEEKEASFVVIRNDGGPTHIFRQYQTAGQSSVTLTGLSSARYVTPESAFVLAVTKSGDTEEVDISLDGPLYKPLGANQVDFIGQLVSVTVPGLSTPLIGTVLGLSGGQDPTVELVLQESKQNVKTKYTTIQQVESSQAMWNRDLQTVTIPLPQSIKSLYLNYQTNTGTFKWIPNYRALVHPSFQYLLSFRCTATVYNQTEEILRVAILRLRIMREEEFVSFDAYPEALMMQSAMPSLIKRSMARAPLSQADSAEDETKTLQEFVSRLPNGEILGKFLSFRATYLSDYIFCCDKTIAKSSCRVPLFQLKKVPLLSWYEMDISFRYGTEDSLNITGYPPKWLLRIQNPATSESKGVKNWPAGSIQLLLPGTTDSDAIQPQKVNWLKKSRLNAVPAGGSDVIQLSSPWNMTLKTKIQVTKTPLQLNRALLKQQAENTSFQLQIHEFTSQIQVEISNSGSGNSRFPLRLRFSTNGFENLEMATRPTWSTLDLDGKSVANPVSVPISVEKDGMYWVLVLPPLTSGFKQVLLWSLKWTELTTVPIKIRGGNRTGGSATESTELSTGGIGQWKMEDTLTPQQLELLTPSQIELPVPVPSDDDDDDDDDESDKDIETKKKNIYYLNSDVIDK